MPRDRRCNRSFFVWAVFGAALSAMGCGSGSDGPSDGTGPKGGNAAGKSRPSSEEKLDDGTGGSVRNGGQGGSDDSGGAGAPRGGGIAGSGKAGGSGAAGSTRGSGGRSGSGGSKEDPPESSTGGRGGRQAGGASGTGGSRNGAAGVPGGAGASAGGAGNADTPKLEPFSFFVTSLRAMQTLSKSEKGFGGDLRFGKADGLAGADEICRQIAEDSMPGSGAKQWRAFLSVTKGPNGSAVNAIDRVGEGPWYDRLGRLVAKTKADLAQLRPNGADPAIRNDLPNEEGVLNHNPDNTGQVDNHDILTGSNEQGKLYKTDWSCTCHDWTSSVASDGRPRVGHSWPRSGTPIVIDTGAGGGMGMDWGTGMGSGWGSGTDTGGFGSMDHWISALDEAGCAAGVNLLETGGPRASDPTVGSGGGYGGIYCLALEP